MSLSPSRLKTGSYPLGGLARSAGGGPSLSRSAGGQS